GRKPSRSLPGPGAPARARQRCTPVAGTVRGPPASEGSQEMTKIEWTERSWNPIVGCSIVSPGCTNCYAMRMAARLESMSVANEARTGGDPGPLYYYRGLTQESRAGWVWTGKVKLAPEDVLLKQLRR